MSLLKFYTFQQVNQGSILVPCHKETGSPLSCKHANHTTISHPYRGNCGHHSAYLTLSTSVQKKLGKTFPTQKGLVRHISTVISKPLSSNVASNVHLFWLYYINKHIMLIKDCNWKPQNLAAKITSVDIWVVCLWWRGIKNALLHASWTTVSVTGRVHPQRETNCGSRVFTCVAITIP